MAKSQSESGERQASGTFKRRHTSASAQGMISPSMASPVMKRADQRPSPCAMPMPVMNGGGSDIYSNALLHEQLQHSNSMGDISPSAISFLTNFDGLGDPSAGSVTIAGTGSNTIVLPPGVSLPKKKSRPAKKPDAEAKAKARAKRKGGEITGEGGSGRWTKEEDAKLRSAVAAVGAKNWKRISQEFLDGRRSDVQCLHRWNKVLKPGLVKGPWTQQEDEIIRGCITEGITKWSEIAAKVPGRIGKQCRERWFNHLDPSIKKSEWSDEEDQILITAQAEMGNKWCEIAKMLPGRSENAVKNRWNSATRRKQQFGQGSEGSKPRRSKSSTAGSGKENSSSSNRRSQNSILSPTTSITPTAPIRAQLHGGLDDSTSPSWGALLPGMGMGMGSNFGSLGGLMAAGLGGISIGSSLDPDDGNMMSEAMPVDPVADPLPMPSHIKMEDSQAMPPPPPTSNSSHCGNGQRSRIQQHEKILANLFKTDDVGKSTQPAKSADFAAQETERLQLFSGVSFSDKEKQKIAGLAAGDGASAIPDVHAAELEEVSQFDLERMFDLLPAQGKGSGGRGNGASARSGGGRGGVHNNSNHNSSSSTPAKIKCSIKSESTAWSHMSYESAPPAISIPTKGSGHGSCSSNALHQSSPGIVNLPGFTPPSASTRAAVLKQMRRGGNMESLEASLDDLDIAMPAATNVDDMFACAPLTA